MNKYLIQDIWNRSFISYYQENTHMPDEQLKASNAIMKCKSGKLGVNISECTNCGHQETHNNSCRNRNCPNCQAVLKEKWVDERRAEVIDAPYFHVVFTLPHELNPLMLCNQKKLYNLLHKCCSETLLQLAENKKYLGAMPGIIQVLHSWSQELLYHPHIHCVVSGGGLTKDGKLKKTKGTFFIPVHVLRDKFQGKFLSNLRKLYKKDELTFSSSIENLKDPQEWNSFIDSLFEKKWCPYIKETFNGFGNAIEYLGRYTHKIAISNSRITEVTENTVSFTARGKKNGDPKRTITLDHQEFIRRYLLHVLPFRFQKIRYYGFLTNRKRKTYLKLIFRLQGYQKFKQRYSQMTMAELIMAVWKVDICLCPNCKKSTMKLKQVTRGNTA